MKKNVHPQLFLAKVRCACGTEYEIPATKKEIVVEVCQNCSPIFTGKEETKIIMGQVEKFLRRQKKAKKR